MFGPEPLKAQAVAARTYTLSRRAQGPHKAQSADVCDTQHCQAFGGFTGEHTAGRAAVDATRGKVLYINGNLFQPLYASACGGHTETAARIYGNEDGGGSDAVPDGELPGGISLASDDGAMQFYKSSWDSYCAGSDRYRWSYTWDAEQLKAIVASGISRFRGTQTVASSESDAKVEMLEGVTVTERGPSGRALAVRFEAPGVSWTVKRDWGIRNFLRIPDGGLLPIVGDCAGHRARRRQEARQADGVRSGLGPRRRPVPVGHEGAGGARHELRGDPGPLLPVGRDWRRRHGEQERAAGARAAAAGCTEACA